MKDSSKILISIIISLVLLQNCKKESNDKPRNDFSADLLIKRLIYYPNDSISLSFEVSPKDGNGPYTYKWIIPDTLNGNGPFTVNLVNDLKILVKITDANSKHLDFSYLIKKDTIDPLKYDYRNDVIGKYLCNFISISHIYKDSEWKLIDKKWQDTLKVYKSEIFNNIICRSNIELIYDLKRNEFGWNIGSTWSYLHVINDTVYYSYTRLARYGENAKGKKINN